MRNVTARATRNTFYTERRIQAVPLLLIPTLTQICLQPYLSDLTDLTSLVARSKNERRVVNETIGQKFPERKKQTINLDLNL